MGIRSEAISILKAHSATLCGKTGRLSIGEELDKKKVERAIKLYANGLDPDEVICMIDDSIARNGATGFLFTDRKLYHTFAPPREVKVWFDEIDAVDVYFSKGTERKPFGVTVTMKDGSTCKLHGACVDAEVLADLLICLKGNVEKAPFAGYPKISASTDDVSAAIAIASGVAAGDADHTLQIQSRYGASGEACIDSLFAEDGAGEYQFIGEDGSPMVVEVPKDEEIYRKAVDKMGQKIAEGKVPGITDVSEAQNLVQQGSITYDQAANIARAGNIDSILFDATGSLVTCVSAFGLSAVTVFATSVWNDEPIDTALKKAAFQGLKIGGSTFVASVLSSQIAKAGFNGALVTSTDAMLAALGPEASAAFGGAVGASRTLTGNIVTATLTVTVLSAFDVADIFRGRISGSQLFKNIAGTATSVAGGTAGWIGGAAVGNAVVPGIGGVVGGLVGSVVAGSGASKAAYTVLDKFIEDDANEMVDIIQVRFQKHAEDYLLNRNEAEKVVDALSVKLDGDTLKKMFASDDRDAFADELLIPLVEERVSRRAHIVLPSNDQMGEAIKAALAELAEEGETYEK